MNNHKLSFIMKYRWVVLIPFILLLAVVFAHSSLQNWGETAGLLYLIGLFFIYNKVRWLGLFLLSLLPTFTSSWLLELGHSFSSLDTLIFWLVFLFSLLCSYFLAREAEIIPKISLRTFPPLKILLGFLILVAVSFIAGLVGQATQTSTTANQSALNKLETMIPYSVFAAQTLFAGFFEELTYRVGIFEIVLKKHPKLAFAVATLLFAFMHAPSDLYSWVFYGGMSFVLTFFYYRYRNFYLNFSIHFLWNLLGLLLAFFLK